MKHEINKLLEVTIMYNLFVKFFLFIGWNGTLPESAAFVCTAFVVLFAANFTISLVTGYNQFWRFIFWLDKVMD